MASAAFGLKRLLLALGGKNIAIVLAGAISMRQQNTPSAAAWKLPSMYRYRKGFRRFASRR